ncbi:MAG: GDP-L-fucose synthase [Gallionellaceae bacterium]|nr:GDP-L-fucose synthase [Gallionellaceae bacterium]
MADTLSKNSRIYVAGHRGLIGSALLRRFKADGYVNLITRDHASLDLADAGQAALFFKEQQPEIVVLAAGKVGGIVENKIHPADFISRNLAIQLNVIRSAHLAGVQRLIFFGSSCMYPRECAQPMAENMLLTGQPEPTSMAYAIAKLAGLQMCLAYNQQYGYSRFVPVIPNSVYGINDNFDPASGHVLSALINRFHDAKVSGAAQVTLWGTGSPRREFLYSDDLASACLALLHTDLQKVELPVNIGPGQDISIKELAELVAGIVGYEGDIAWDSSKPDGTPRKLLDSTRMKAIGWQAKTALRDGIQQTYNWYLNHKAQII